MTTQAGDGLNYEGTPYILSLAVGEGLFDPKESGIEPSMASTACYKGYSCGYSVSNGELRLDELEIKLPREWVRRLRQGDRRLGICGRVPQLVPDGQFRICGNATLENARIPIPFTGGMVAGHGDPDDPVDGGPFGSAWQYRSVLEFRFQAGRLERIVDRSEDMGECRRIRLIHWHSGIRALELYDERKRIGASGDVPPVSPGTADPSLSSSAAAPASDITGSEPALRRNFRECDLAEVRARNRLRWPFGEIAASLPRAEAVRAVLPGQYEEKVLDMKLDALLPTEVYFATYKTVPAGTFGDLLDLLMAHDPDR